jgi:hypothetical protein
MSWSLAVRLAILIFQLLSGELGAGRALAVCARLSGRWNRAGRPGCHWPGHLEGRFAGWDHPRSSVGCLSSVPYADSARAPLHTRLASMADAKPSESGNLRSNVTFHLVALTSLQLGYQFSAVNSRLALFT